MSGIFFCGSRRVRWSRELPPPSQETAPQLKALVFGEVRNGGVVVLELVLAFSARYWVLVFEVFGVGVP